VSVYVIGAAVVSVICALALSETYRVDIDH